MPDVLERSVFWDRGRQFVERMNWNLCVTPDGCEVDEYDDIFSKYLVVHENLRHLGSCRVRPISAGTMLRDHFMSCFPISAPFLQKQEDRVFELTRFCRAPDITVSESKAVLANLAVLLDCYRDREGLTGFVAVVFPKVARFLDSIGVRFLILDHSIRQDEQILLICITHAVDVRDKRAVKKPVRTDRLKAA